MIKTEFFDEGIDELNDKLDFFCWFFSSLKNQQINCWWEEISITHNDANKMIFIWTNIYRKIVAFTVWQHLNSLRIFEQSLLILFTPRKIYMRWINNNLSYFPHFSFWRHIHSNNKTKKPYCTTKNFYN